MPIVFACASSHAPGITAWPDAALPEQRQRVRHAFEYLRTRLEEAGVEELVLFTSEHWANFFLHHISPFCVGRGELFNGPVEPWLNVPNARVKGNPELAERLLKRCYEFGIEPGYSYELALDHGTMVPLHLLTPSMDKPIVPILINTLAAPQPSAARCLELGRVVGEVASESDRRIGILATGGMSHDPGELRHGEIDSDFDRRFLVQMCNADIKGLTDYSIADLRSAGAGTIELLSWIALAGIFNHFSGEVVAYEPIRPWATGIGMMILNDVDGRARAR